jgi:HK97 family phage prohead protease
LSIFDRTRANAGHEAKSRSDRLRPSCFRVQRIEAMTLTSPPNNLRTALPAGLEFKASSEGRIEGYASTVGGPPDRQGDIGLAGTFARSLASHKAAGTLPAMLWSHRIEDPIGCWDAMAEDSTGLHVKGVLNLRTERGREAFEHVKAGDAGACRSATVSPTAAESTPARASLCSSRWSSSRRASWPFRPPPGPGSPT